MKIVDCEEGYKLFSHYYYKYYQHLDSFDWEITKNLLYSKIDFIYGKNQKIFLADLGCGDGRVLKRVESYLLKKEYKNNNLFGLDISQDMMKIAKKKIRTDVKFIKINLEKAKIDFLFDLIYSFFLLVHIQDIESFFSNVSNSLNSEGIFIFNNIEQKKGFQLPFLKEQTYIKFYNHPENKINLVLQKYFAKIDKIKTEFSTIYICEI